MPPAGRPRTFDREAALTAAMHLFWEKGYEGTTMADIIETLGVKAPSVYAAFGNKDKLFEEVVKAYSKIVEVGPLKVLMETQNIYEAIENSLKASVEIFTSPDNPSSCLVMSAAINCAPEHIEHVKQLRKLRANYKEACEQRLIRASEEGQLKEGASAKELAEFLMTLVHGMALRAKDGSTAQELTQTCNFALGTLKTYIK